MVYTSIDGAIKNCRIGILGTHLRAFPREAGGNTMPLNTVQHDHPDTVVAARWAEHLTGDETGEVFDVPKVGFNLKERQCPMDIRVKAQCRQGVL